MYFGYFCCLLFAGTAHGIVQQIVCYSAHIVQYKFTLSYVVGFFRRFFLPVVYFSNNFRAQTAVCRLDEPDCIAHINSY